MNTGLGMSYQQLRDKQYNQEAEAYWAKRKRKNIAAKYGFGESDDPEYEWEMQKRQRQKMMLAQGKIPPEQTYL